MHAMQYEITLPADYDMNIIRRRVETRGSGTDSFPGLGLKFYAVRERGVNGSPVNQYAPFYLWTTPAGMNQFLFGVPFEGIITDFGRPTVRHWNGLGYLPGPAVASLPQTATRAATPVRADLNLQTTVSQAVETMRYLGDRAGVHSSTVGLDPRTWELVHFTVWAQPSPKGEGDRYEVLHTSSPHQHDLPVGRSW